MKLNVLYEDEYLLVIDKPVGLVVTPSETQHENTLAEILQKDYQINLERGGIVHRLDKDTSGVLLVAKDLTSFEKMQEQFKSRQVKKEYVALVHGFLEKGGVIEGEIGRNPKNREKFTVTTEGKEAVTEYEPIKKCQMIFSDYNKIQMRKLIRMGYEKFTLLTLKPLTGRTHQIRVHLKYINHPVVADEKYAGRKVYRMDKRWCPRQFLHAKKIGFYHPKSGKWMEFESKLPDDLEKALNLLDG